MARTKEDPTHIMQFIYDPDKESIQTSIVGTEMQIELDAEDGDSVQAIRQSKMLKESDGPQDCRGMSSVCLFGEGQVSVSPEDEGEEFHQLDLSPLEPRGLCARRIKISGPGKVVMHG